VSHYLGAAVTLGSVPEQVLEEVGHLGDRNPEKAFN